MALPGGTAYNNPIIFERMVHSMKKLAALLISLVVCLSVLTAPVQAQGCDANGSGPEYGYVLGDDERNTELDDLVMPLDDFPMPELIDG